MPVRSPAGTFAGLPIGAHDIPMPYGLYAGGGIRHSPPNRWEETPFKGSHASIGNVMYPHGVLPIPMQPGIASHSQAIIDWWKQHWPNQRVGPGGVRAPLAGPEHEILPDRVIDYLLGHRGTPGHLGVPPQPGHKGALVEAVARAGTALPGLARALYHVPGRILENEARTNRFYALQEELHRSGAVPQYGRYNRSSAAAADILYDPWQTRHNIHPRGG